MLNKSMFFLQEEAYARGIEKNDICYIAKDTEKGGKIVSSFKNIDEFLTWYDGQTVKNFYEKIIDERVEYYDIDGKPNENEYYKKDTQTIIDDLLRHRKNWISTTNYENKVQDDVYVLESKDLNVKKSYHIVIRNSFVFKDNKDQKKFVNEFSEYLKEHGNGLQIDTAPYGQNQCFRIIGSCKIGSNRSLIRSSYNKLSQECDRKMFFASYIQPEMDIVADSLYFVKRNTFDNIKDFEQYKQFVLNFVNIHEVIKIVCPIEHKQDQISNEEALIMFEHLSIKRFDDYSTTLSLIWLAKKLDLSDSDVHKLCSQSDKYHEQWVQKIIDTRKEECTHTISTLYYYLKQDVDKETLDRIFPKSKTYKEIKSIQKNRRTLQEQKYLDDINNKILTKQINSLFIYEKSTFIWKELIPESIEYVQDIVFPPNIRCIGIDAGLGRGKTTSLIRYVGSLPKEAKVLILSPRITFAQNICAEYNTNLDSDRQFICYKDFKSDKKKLNFENKIVISMESIHYLESFTPDLLIIDECNANLVSHVSIETSGKNIDNNIYQFKRMLEYSKQVVVADAFIGSKVCDFFTDLKIQLHVYKYLKKLERKDAVFLKPTPRIIKKQIKYKYDGNKDIIDRKTFEIDTMNIKIHELLAKGKKVYGFFSTRTFIENIEKSMKDSYKTLFYSGTSQNIIPDSLDDVWSNQDFIGTTCTITVGCNHSRKNVFDTKIIDFSNRSNNNVSDAIQSHYRVRHIVDNEIYVKVEEHGFNVNFPINMRKFEDTLKHKGEWYAKMNKCFDSVPTYINNLIKHNYIENELSKVAPKKMMIKYLTECNYNIVDYIDEGDMDYDGEVEIDDRDDTDETVNLLKEFAKDCPNFIRFKELENMKLTRKLTQGELNEIDKYFFIQIYTGGSVSGIIDANLPTIALAYRLWTAKFKGNKTLRAMRLEKRLLNGEITIEDLIEKRWEKSQFSELQSQDIIKIRRILDVCNKLGLKHSNDCDTIITQDTIDDFYRDAHTEYDEIRKDMGVQDRRKNKGDISKKQFTGLIQSCFTECETSLCKLNVHESIAKKVAGKTVKKSVYKLFPNKEILADVYLTNQEIWVENERGGNFPELNDDNITNILYDNLVIRDNKGELDCKHKRIL